MENKLKLKSNHKQYSQNINSNFAFSFIELIVGITISMILMLSVSLFVQDGIKNITNQKSSLQNDVKIKEFTKNIYETLSFANKSFKITNLNSGVLLKIDKNYDKGGFSYIGETVLNKFYCDSGSDSENTRHITIKSFIPFEGLGGDIFAGTNYNNGGITTNLFSGTINNLTGILLGPSDIALGIGNIAYVSDTLGNSVYEFNKVPSPNSFKKIVGKDVFGNDFLDGNYGTGIFLNSPTGLSFSTIGGTGFLFISDTLNDRILYLDTSNNKIYKLLSREDGLHEPTGIYYDDGIKALYIANSGKKEIIKYSSDGNFINSASINFTPTKDITNTNKLEFSFIFSTGTTNPNLTSPTSTGDIIMPPALKNEDFLTLNTNKLTYYFVKYDGPDVSESNCISSPSYVIGTSGNPIYCTMIGTGTTSTYQNKTFLKGTNYQITINNISGASFSNTGTYYIKLNFLYGTNVKKTYYFPYFTIGDNDIFSKDDNTMKILTGSLGYPTGIYPTGVNLNFNDFLNREKIKINKGGNHISSTTLTSMNFESIPKNKYTDTVLFTPIKSYDIKFDAVNNLLNIYINYYKNYSCYGDENINSTKDFILKKNLK
nr:hypothetical protein [Candidatus Gracilibacteria bacterium]